MKKLFIIAAAALVGMASCSKENVEKPEYGQDGVGTLNISLKKELTRAISNGTEEESAVSTLEIFIFEDDGETPDAQNAYVKLTSPDFGDYEEDESEFSPTWDGQYVTQIQVDAGTKMVLVVANAELGELEEDETFEDIMAKIAEDDAYVFSTGEAASESLNTRSVPENGFVMAGFNLEAPVIAEKANTIEVTIYRNVSKITAPTADADGVTFNFTQPELDKLLGQKAGDTGYVVIADVNGEDPEIESSFKLTGYAVVNGLPKSTVAFIGTASPYSPELGFTAPDTFTNPWDNWNAGEFLGLDWEDQITATNGAGETLRGPRIRSNSDWMKENDKTMANIAEWKGVYSGENKMIPIAGAGANTEPVVYVYENKPGLMQEQAGTYKGYNADQVIAIIVAGTITIDGEDYPRYWRVNVIKDDAYHVIRNSVFNTSVSEIITAGWETPWEAEEETPIIAKPDDTISEFVISIAPWEVKLVGNGQI
jgi:hypothetical protein